MQIPHSCSFLFASRSCSIHSIVPGTGVCATCVTVTHITLSARSNGIPVCW